MFVYLIRLRKRRVLRNKFKILWIRPLKGRIHLTKKLKITESADSQLIESQHFYFYGQIY